MKALKITVAWVLLCALCIGGEISAVAQEVATSSDIVIPSETNAFVDDFYIDETNQDTPFFTDVLPVIAANIKESNTHTVTPYYDEFPLSNNPTNFQGLGAVSYANINGKTVTAESFYIPYNTALYDPNCGMGLLLYQCIRYKLAHPEEDVEIGFSSYRTSATAAVCVIPESKYYGYTRSLYGTNYDEQGFVRIVYMLTEAARLGIKVTMINQLPSYGVWQYDPVQEKARKRNHLDFKKYFKSALKTECYDEFAEGKKVSDFLDFVVVDWTVKDQSSNMQHLKSLAVSNYLATDGTEHGPAVYFGSSNLDETTHKGGNGNGGSQCGVIISDHDDLVRLTFNYMKLMKEYSYQEGLQELRLLMARRNEQQIALIKAGKENEIPPDEQIVYLGSETDPVFELYFTPLGGAPDTWDMDRNPICNYFDKFSQSEDYVELSWNQYYYSEPYIGSVIEKMVHNAYCQNPHPDNKISTRIEGFDAGEIPNLELGKEIGYRNMMHGEHIHSKDILLSYVEDGERQYVSMLMSANFGVSPLYHRTNSILVIKENDTIGNGFYQIYGESYSYGMIKNECGKFFESNLGNSEEEEESTSDGLVEETEQDSNGNGNSNTDKKPSFFPTVDDFDLPLGAVVAIIAGAAVVAAIGTFSVVWFGIKKKKFSDLKGIFKK